MDGPASVGARVVGDEPGGRAGQRGASGAASRTRAVPAASGYTLGGFPTAHPRGRDRQPSEEAAHRARFHPLHRPARAPGGCRARAGSAARGGPAGRHHPAAARDRSLAPSAISRTRAASRSERPGAASHPHPRQARAIRRRGRRSGRRAAGHGVRPKRREAADRAW